MIKAKKLINEDSQELDQLISIDFLQVLISKGEAMWKMRGLNHIHIRYAKFPLCYLNQPPVMGIQVEQ